MQKLYCGENNVRCSSAKDKQSEQNKTGLFAKLNATLKKVNATRWKVNFLVFKFYINIIILNNNILIYLTTNGVNLPIIDFMTMQPAITKSATFGS